MHNARNSNRKISELLGISKTIVENAVKWVPKTKTRGRKQKITPVVKRNIMRCVKKNLFLIQTDTKLFKY